MASLAPHAPQAPYTATPPWCLTKQADATVRGVINDVPHLMTKCQAGGCKNKATTVCAVCKCFGLCGAPECAAAASDVHGGHAKTCHYLANELRTVAFFQRTSAISAACDEVAPFVAASASASIRPLPKNASLDDTLAFLAAVNVEGRQRLGADVVASMWNALRYGGTVAKLVTCYMGDQDQWTALHNTASREDLRFIIANCVNMSAIFSTRVWSIFTNNMLVSLSESFLLVERIASRCRSLKLSKPTAKTPFSKDQRHEVLLPLIRSIHNRKFHGPNADNNRCRLLKLLDACIVAPPADYRAEIAHVLGVSIVARVERPLSAAQATQMAKAYAEIDGRFALNLLRFAMGVDASTALTAGTVAPTTIKFLDNMRMMDEAAALTVLTSAATKGEDDLAISILRIVLQSASASADLVAFACAAAEEIAPRVPRAGDLATYVRFEITDALQAPLAFSRLKAVHRFAQELGSRRVEATTVARLVRATGFDDGTLHAARTLWVLGNMVRAGPEALVRAVLVELGGAAAVGARLADGLVRCVQDPEANRGGVVMLMEGLLATPGVALEFAEGTPRLRLLYERLRADLDMSGVAAKVIQLGGDRPVDLDVLVFRILKALKTRACAVCSAPTRKKCSTCRAMYYCGRGHQLEHWAKHKKVCEDPAVACSHLFPSPHEAAAAPPVPEGDVVVAPLAASPPASPPPAVPASVSGPEPVAPVPTVDNQLAHLPFPRVRVAADGSWTIKSKEEVIMVEGGPVAGSSRDSGLLRMLRGLREALDYSLVMQYSVLLDDDDDLNLVVVAKGLLYKALQDRSHVGRAGQEVLVDIDDIDVVLHFYHEE